MDHDLFNYSVYIFFGALPSLLWLQFYLRKDVKPEPKPMILKVFFYGMLCTIPAIILEIAFYRQMEALSFFSTSVAFAINTFLGVAFVEEALKFAVIRLKVLNDPEFDEPIDAMIYMIVAALGFAAAENLLVLFSVGKQYSAEIGFLFPFLREQTLWQELFQVSLLRFLGATFLHALSSAIIGFFLGLSFFKKERRGLLIGAGLLFGSFLHGLYNFSIIKVENSLDVFIPFFLLIIAAVFVSLGFKKLTQMKQSA